MVRRSMVVSWSGNNFSNWSYKFGYSWSSVDSGSSVSRIRATVVSWSSYSIFSDWGWSSIMSWSSIVS